MKFETVVFDVREVFGSTGPEIAEHFDAVKREAVELGKVVSGMSMDNESAGLAGFRISNVHDNEPDSGVGSEIDDDGPTRPNSSSFSQAPPVCSIQRRAYIGDHSYSLLLETRVFILEQTIQSIWKDRSEQVGKIQVSRDILISKRSKTPDFSPK